MHRSGSLTVAGFVLCGLLWSLLAVIPAAGQEETAPDTLATEDSVRVDGVRMDHGVPMSKNPTLAALASFAVPGLGQFYTENYLKAVLFFGVDVGMWYGVYVQNDRYHEYEEQIDQQKSPVQKAQAQRLADFYKSDRNRLIWWTAGVTLLATFDSYVNAHLYDFEIDPTVGATPSGDGPAAGIRITF